VKQLVTEYHALNIKELGRGWLSPFSRFDWVWRMKKRAGITVVTVTVLEQSLQVSYPMASTHVQQEIHLTYSAGPHGGKRPWFLCPTCQQRVGILYQAAGLPFRCRTCSALAYPSQYQSRDRSYGRGHRTVSYRERDQLVAQCAV
jgi:hypothetical protein